MSKITNKDRFGNELTVDQMIKAWKRQVDKEGTLYECKRREFYQTPKEKRIEKAKRARLLSKPKHRSF